MNTDRRESKYHKSNHSYTQIRSNEKFILKICSISHPGFVFLAPPSFNTNDIQMTRVYNYVLMEKISVAKLLKRLTARSSQYLQCFSSLGGSNNQLRSNEP